MIWKPLFGEAIRYVFLLNAYRGALKTSLKPNHSAGWAWHPHQRRNICACRRWSSDGITRRLSGNEDGAFTEV